MKRFAMILFLTCLAFLFVGGAVRAAIEAYDLSWYTVDGGGGTSQGGTYELSGSIAQPDAGLLSGGDYDLSGGFWHVQQPAEQGDNQLFLPFVIR